MHLDSRTLQLTLVQAITSKSVELTFVELTFVDQGDTGENAAQAAEKHEVGKQKRAT